MAWDRRIELVVGSGTEGVLVSDLDMTFDVNRSITFAENTAKFTIYNASRATRTDILRERQNLIFRAGYNTKSPDSADGTGVFGTIFIGSITRVTSNLNGANWETHIEASAMRGEGVPLDRTVVSLSYAPDTSAATILNALGDILGLVVTGSENAALVNLPRGYVWAGQVRGALYYLKKILAASGLGMFIDNAEIIVYSISGSSKFSSIAYLTYESGLLSAENITASYIDMASKQQAVEEAKTAEAKENASAAAEEVSRKRISFSSILNPNIKPNSLVTVKTDSLDGVYLVESVNFTGSNFDSNYTCKGEASA